MSDKLNEILSKCTPENRHESAWNDIDELTTKIKQWAIERNLHSANPDKQMLKLFEELGELAEGMAKDKPEQIKDSIGDVYVVLTILSLQLGINIEDCIAQAYDEIKDRRGKMIDGVFVKESDLRDTDKDNDFLEDFQDYQGDWEDD